MQEIQDIPDYQEQLQKIEEDLVNKQDESIMIIKKNLHFTIKCMNGEDTPDHH